MTSFLTDGLRFCFLMLFAIKSRKHFTFVYPAATPRTSIVAPPKILVSKTTAAPTGTARRDRLCKIRKKWKHLLKQYFATMLLRIILFLSFLLQREVILSKGSSALWVQAFSVVPRAKTRAPGLRDCRFQTLQRKPREIASSSSSLYTWQIPFGSARKIPTRGKDGLYHITTEEEYRCACK